MSHRSLTITNTQRDTTATTITTTLILSLFAKIMINIIISYQHCDELISQSPLHIQTYHHNHVYHTQRKYHTHRHAHKPSHIHTSSHTHAHTPSHIHSTCSSTEIVSAWLSSFASAMASSPPFIVVVGEMASAWLTLQQHALDMTTLAPAHSPPKGAQPLHTHYHPTGETNTHVIFGVDVGLGFGKCDGDIGTAILRSRHQRRPIALRTHNDTETQSKCVGIPHLTRTLAL